MLAFQRELFLSSEDRYGRDMYRQVFAGSSTPFERLSTLFIGALRLARQGREAALHGDAELARERADRVAGLLRRLDVCLDHKAAPALCENLSRLYKHMDARLSEEEAAIDPAAFDEVLAILNKLWEGFQEAEQRGHS
jgi:flagellar biosynthetic protein FliS